MLSDRLETKDYDLESVLNGTLWEDGAQYDKHIHAMSHILDKYYYKQAINPLASPPRRPPVKHVYCVYGINEKTEIAYRYRIVDEAFRIKKIIWEDQGGEVYSTTALLNRKKVISRSVWGKSGDGSVSYNSLNWCQAWHVSDVRLTEVPTKVDTSSRLQGLQQMLGLQKLVYGKYRYDSSANVGGRTFHTSVIELEHQNHRDIIRSKGLIDLLKQELDPRTQVEYSPFEGEDDFDMKNLERKATKELEEMAELLRNELSRRKRKVERDKVSPHPFEGTETTEEGQKVTQKLHRGEDTKFSQKVTSEGERSSEPVHPNRGGPQEAKKERIS
jgi:hypothetical protein